MVNANFEGGSPLNHLNFDELLIRGKEWREKNLVERIFMVILKSYKFRLVKQVIYYFLCKQICSIYNLEGIKKKIGP